MAARQRSRQRASTTSSAPARCRTRTSSARAAARRVGREPHVGLSHARDRRHARVRGRRPRGDGLRRRRAGRAPRRRRSRRFASRCPTGEHLLAVAVHAAPTSEAQVGQDESCPRAQEPHGLRLGLLPAARAPGRSGARSAQDPGRAERLHASRFDGVGRARRGSDGDVVLGGRTRPGALVAERQRRAAPVRRARRFRVGFRTIELQPNEDAPADALPYTLYVNGERTFIRGWNWVPIDALYGVPRPEKVRHLLELAAHANVNVLRVWGGGLIETRGVLRPLRPARASSSGRSSRSRAPGSRATPSDDAGVRGDARRRRARDRPAARAPPVALRLVRRQRARLSDGERSTSRRPPSRTREVVRELDPGRVWLPTSPTGPQGRYDMHGPWEHQGLREHNAHYDSRTNLDFTASSASRA